MITMQFLLVSVVLLFASSAAARGPESKCDQSITTASGTHVHRGIPTCNGMFHFGSTLLTYVP